MKHSARMLAVTALIASSLAVVLLLLTTDLLLLTTSLSRSAPVFLNALAALCLLVLIAMPLGAAPSAYPAAPVEDLSATTASIPQTASISTSTGAQFPVDTSDHFSSDAVVLDEARETNETPSDKEAQTGVEVEESQAIEDEGGPVITEPPALAKVKDDAPSTFREHDKFREHDNLSDDAWSNLVEECVRLFDEIERVKPQYEAPRLALAEHVTSRLSEILERNSVQVISDDAHFSRQRHQPEGTIAAKVKDGTLIEKTLSPGFAIGPRVLRRAKVSLARTMNQ